MLLIILIQKDNNRNNIIFQGHGSGRFASLHHLHWCPSSITNAAQNRWEQQTVQMSEGRDPLLPQICPSYIHQYRGSLGRYSPLNYGNSEPRKIRKSLLDFVFQHFVLTVVNKIPMGSPPAGHKHNSPLCPLYWGIGGGCDTYLYTV